MTTDMTLYQPKNLTELKEFCQMITKTNLVPVAYRNKPEDAMVAIMFGSETGQLGPLASLQFVAVINGRPGYYSDAVPGIALNKGLITDIEEFTEGNPYDDDFRHVVQITKRNGKKTRSEFSVADAKRAGLWDKPGPWKQYPKRMLQWRAKGFGVRDAVPHLLFGNTVEELRDMEDQAQRHPEDARDITPREFMRASRPPEVLEVVDPHGDVVHIQPGELEALVANWVDVATDDELNELARNNPELQAVQAAIEAEEVRRQERREEEAAAAAEAEPSGDPLHLFPVKGAMRFLELLRVGLAQAPRNDADRLWQIYRARAEAADAAVKKGDYAKLVDLVVAKITPPPT